MANNPYFNFYNQKSEQSLANDLVAESIRQFGHNVYYLPRNIDLQDKILNEPEIVTFSKAIKIEVFIKSWDAFQGEGQFLQKFGLEVRDKATLVMSEKSFAEFIRPITNKSRPEEGDCLYIPLFKVIYQILYVDNAVNFYFLGDNYSWDLDCQIMEFSNEQFKTGIPEIDNINKPFQHTDDPNYDLKSYDKTSQNKEIQEQSDIILDWTEKNPFGDV